MQDSEMFEMRIARLEKYLQHEGHDITKYDNNGCLPNTENKLGYDPVLGEPPYIPSDR